MEGEKKIECEREEEEEDGETLLLQRQHILTQTFDNTDITHPRHPQCLTISVGDVGISLKSSCRTLAVARRWRWGKYFASQTEGCCSEFRK